MGSSIFKYRADLLTDSMALLKSWENQGDNRQLNNVIKQLFEWVYTHDIDLNLSYVPFASKQADLAS